VPRAWGRVADCYLQLGTAEGYDSATNYYSAVLTNAADVATRSMAEVGLGVALEAMAKSASAPAELAPLLDAAFNHYTTVFYEKNIRDGETADPFWIEKSGLAASKLAEARKTMGSGHQSLQPAPQQASALARTAGGASQSRPRTMAGGKKLKEF